MNNLIEQLLDLTNYASDIRKNRRKDNNGKKATNEFFTPYSIVKRMGDKISDDDWKDPEKTWLEPCMCAGKILMK